MDAENNHEGNHLALRIARGTSLIALGGALVSRLPQLLPGQKTPLWYQSPFMIMGIIIALIGVLILFAPSKFWRNLWNSLIRLPRWFGITYTWLRYSPRYRISDPTFTDEFSKTNYEEKITAIVNIWIKNRNKPLKINLNSANVCLELRVGWEQQKVRFRLDTKQGISEIILKPGENWQGQVSVTMLSQGNLEPLFDIRKMLHYGVWGICVILPHGGMKQLHKGSDCQPRRQSSVGII